MKPKIHKREKFGLTRCGKHWVRHPGVKTPPVKKSTDSWVGTTCEKCLAAGLISCGRDSGLK